MIQSLIKRRIALEYRRMVDQLLSWEDKYLEELLAGPGLEALAESPSLGTEKLVARDAELRQSALAAAERGIELDLRNMMDILPEFHVFRQRIKRGTRRSVKSLAENRGLSRARVDKGFTTELESKARNLGISKLG